MARKEQALTKYRSMIAEADKLAEDAAQEVRTKAKEHIQAIRDLNNEYEELTGKTLPEYARLNGGARKSAGGSQGGGRKTKLSGQYADMTVPNAIVKSLKGVKNGLGPREVAEKIGGNKNTVTVAMSNMAQEGTLKRPSRGKYTL